MARGLDRHTLADLTVNIVPLVILALFAGLFALYSPWGRLGLASVIQFGLLVVVGTLLAYVSLKSGVAVAETDEE